MPGLTIHQRCWNHEVREAVCRCPECRRSFCRECVTEHEARLLCASCLNALARTPESPSGKWRFALAGMLLAGILLSWLVFFGAGAALNLFASRMEQSSWQAQ